jgi:hypothetical protein
MSRLSNPAVDIMSLVTPSNQWVSVRPGPVDSSTLSMLQEHGYDQAPVLDRPGKTLLGIVDTSYLRDLAATGQALRDDDPRVCSDRHFLGVGEDVDIDVIKLLSALVATQALLVMYELDLGDRGIHRSHGFLTISDLNRHALRAALYSAIATLEWELARAVPAYFPDPWEWIGGLPEHHQVAIVGYWELTRRKRIDISPITATTLAQLLQIAARSPSLLTRLGFRSRNEFESRTGRISGLRNCVMHPVRPLVLEHGQVATILETLRTILDLASKLEHQNNTAL